MYVIQIAVSIIMGKRFDEFDIQKSIPTAYNVAT